MGTVEATQVALAGMAALVAVGQLALTIFSGSRVEHMRAQHMANLAAAITAADQDPSTAGAVPDLRADLRIATMQYRVARLTQTSLRLWGVYWLALLGVVLFVYISMSTGSWTLEMSSGSEDIATILVFVLVLVLTHLIAAYSTRRRQRPAIKAVDPTYLTVDPPDSPDAGSGASDSGGRPPTWLARDLWQEDRRARHDLRRRRLQPRLGFWSIRLASVVTGVISGVLLSYGIAAVLHRLAPPPAKHMLLDGVVIEVISTSARDAAVLSIVALPWIVLVYWVTWLMVERPWNIRPKVAPAAGSAPSATASPVWLILGLLASRAGSKESRPPTRATTP